MTARSAPTRPEATRTRGHVMLTLAAAETALLDALAAEDTERLGLKVSRSSMVARLAIAERARRARRESRYDGPPPR